MTALHAALHESNTLCGAKPAKRYLGVTWSNNIDDVTCKRCLAEFAKHHVACLADRPKTGSEQRSMCGYQIQFVSDGDRVECLRCVQTLAQQAAEKVSPDWRPPECIPEDHYGA